MLLQTKLLFCEISINPLASETKRHLRKDIHYCFIVLAPSPPSVSFQLQTHNAHTRIGPLCSHTHIHIYSHTRLHLRVYTHTHTQTEDPFALPHRGPVLHTSGLTVLYIWRGSRKAPPYQSCCFCPCFGGSKDAIGWCQSSEGVKLI